MLGRKGRGGGVKVKSLDEFGVWLSLVVAVPLDPQLQTRMANKSQKLKHFQGNIAFLL